MKKKLSNILLIDDSKADNYLHKRIIERAKIAEKVTITYGAREALDYLSKLENEKFPCPEIIFLDINMPDMSGWDFLDEYRLLDEDKKARIVVCLLTTSRASEDKEKAAEYDVLDNFSTKPLTEEKLRYVLEKKFPDYL